jgi:hypothetical protein
MKARKKAMLDRVFVAPDAYPLPELSVQWHSPDIIIDHAVLLIRIQHSRIRTGYAGHIALIGRLFRDSDAG